MPPLYSKTTLVFMMLLYFAFACIAAYLLTKNNYPADQTTNWVLVGGLTSESVTFRVRKSPSITRLVVSKKYFSDVIYNQTLLDSSTDEQQLVTSMTVSGLNSNTQYYYSSRDDNEKIYREGTFRTAPVEGNRTATRFKFATAGCAQSGSHHDIFSVIRDEDPLFFLHLGDIHYEDIHADNVERRINALDRVMNSPTQRDLFSIPLTYIWDNHD